MNDVVFSCPSCRKPLVVEEAAAGTRIQCPLCEADVRIPQVKTAWLKKDLPGEDSDYPVWQRLEPEALTLLDRIEESSRRLSRKSREQERQLESVSKSLTLVRERMQIFERHLEPLRFRNQPSESVQIPEEWSPVPGEGPWKVFTLSFGLISILLAAGMLVMTR
jgi:DNA-directed RNA polymerase subunit RPC12/RpoP